jgi:hypothetical protein
MLTNTVVSLPTLDGRLGDADRARFLSERAIRWRKEIQLLAVLVKASREDTRANIRALYERIDNELPSNLSSPPDLRDAVGVLFRTDLAEHINRSLLATVNAPVPDRELLIEWAGVDAGHLERVTNALWDSGSVRKLEEDREQLSKKNVRPTPPAGMQPPPEKKKPEPPPGPRPVKEIQVDESHDQRKRELGNEGERWALAAVIDALMHLDDQARDIAIGEIKSLLTEQFKGNP